MNGSSDTNKVPGINNRSTSATMQALTLKAPGKFSYGTVSRPEPGPDEVLVKIEGCGICASNIPVWEGRDWFKYPVQPGAPGHEGYGTVEKTGVNVTRFSEGNRVALVSKNAFAEYDLAKEDHIVPIPYELEHTPFPGEPLGSAMNIFNRADIIPGQIIAVIGVGFLGSLLIQMAAKKNVKIIAISKRYHSLSLAEKYGADELISLDDQNIPERVSKITDGQMCDRVIEATGKQEALDVAGEIVSQKGKLIIAGYHEDGLRNVNMQLWNWKGVDVINAHERDPRIYAEGIRKAIDAVKNCKIDFTPLLTHYFFPDEVHEAFQLLTSRTNGFVKGIIKF